ncbi:hypothetical protein IAU59_000806 [Kwoniella sp. CBS 9459]
MAQQSPTILLFARGALALLDLWPALTIAVAEQWGGPDSAAKKTWLASTIIDEFESRATYLPSADEAAAPVVDPATATDPPLDQDDLGDLLHQIMSDEFDANIEDGSIDSIAADIVRLWRDVLGPEATLLVSNLEGKANEIRRTGIKASAAPDQEELSGEESEGDEDEEMDEAPQLVQSDKPQREREEPVVDDDGFTLVQKTKRR